MDTKALKINPRHKPVWKVAILVALIGGVLGCHQRPRIYPLTITLTPFSTLIVGSPTSSLQNFVVPTPLVRLSGDNEDAFKVQLQSRQFVPEAETRSGLEWLRTLHRGRVHALLQLYGPPSSADKALLEQSGIKLLDYIPSNTWFASLPTDLRPDDPAFAMIRWFGPILPEDKVYAKLLDDSVGEWALREGGRIAVEVAFFSDVDLSEARQIVPKYDAVLTGSVPLSNKLILEIPKHNILLLAAEDSVRWVDVVPPPPTTNSEGG